MKVSFITVCYNTPNLIRVLLRGVEQAGFSFPFEYFLVDNGQDGTGEFVRKRFPWVTVIEPGKNIGFAAGNNLAIERATGEYIMLVNPDLTIFQGEVEKLVAFADTAPDAGIMGPWIESPNGTRQETCTRFPSFMLPAYNRTFLGRTPWGKRVLDRHHMRDVNHTEPHDAEVIYGAAMLIRRSAIKDIGAFDERFFMYCEDWDLCRRAWKSGWRVVFVPHARFIHYHQRESLINAPWEILTNRTARIHIASGVKYTWKYLNEPIPEIGTHDLLSRDV